MKIPILKMKGLNIMKFYEISVCDTRGYLKLYDMLNRKIAIIAISSLLLLSTILHLLIYYCVK